MPGNGSGNALHINIRFQLLRAMDISVADLHGPRFGRIESETGRIGIEARAIEVPTTFVGLASRENGSIEFELAPNIPKGGYAKGDVGGIKPMMGNGSFGIIHARVTMHECGRPKGRFP